MSRAAPRTAVQDAVRRAYAELLARKQIHVPLRGLGSVPPLAAHLYPFQRRCVEFGLRAGSWACFLDTGLGKTACELEWAHHAAVASNGRALILTPLAVARQIEAEGRRWGYDNIRVIRTQDDAGQGINIANYERLDKLDVDTFAAVVLDESSILKNAMGTMSAALIAALAGHRFRMAATATPAPNDYMELGQHAEALGVMSRADMLIRWFTHDSGETKTWRLKGHAELDFWDWVASWACMAEHPRDLGDDRTGFDLPGLEVVTHRVAGTVPRLAGTLFGDAPSATTMHAVKRETIAVRAARVREIIAAEPHEPWVIWCDTDYESEALMGALAPLALPIAEVRGSYSLDRKESILEGFAVGGVQILVTKPSICGFGLNWQHIARVAFVGRSFSYESWYQAVRRCWRYGQTRPVVVHLVVTHGEAHIGHVLNRKAADHRMMKVAMIGATRRAIERSMEQQRGYVPTHEGAFPGWL